MSILARKVRMRDAQELIALSRQFDGDGPDIVDDVEVVRESIEHNPTELVLVAEDDEKLVGFATLQLTDSFSYKRKTAELTGIYVEEASRRLGVASKLVENVMRTCEVNNVLELFLRVNKNNNNAIRFYEKSGLKQADHFEYRIKCYE